MVHPTFYSPIGLYGFLERSALTSDIVTPARSIKAKLISPGENIPSNEEQSKTRQQESWDLHSTRVMIQKETMREKRKVSRNGKRRQSHGVFFLF